MAKTKKPADAAVFFRLPNELLSELEAFCSQQNKSKSEVLRQMVEQYVTSEAKKTA